MDAVNTPAKFEVPSFTRSCDNRGYSNWAVPRYGHAPFSLQFLRGLCSHGPVNTGAIFEVRSFTRSWDNRGTQKMGRPWIRPRSLFSPIFKGLLFGWMDPVNIPAKFEVRSFKRSWDNRGHSKNLGRPGYAHAPFSPKFFMGFCSDGPCECIGQICSGP